MKNSILKRNEEAHRTTEVRIHQAGASVNLERAGALVKKSTQRVVILPRAAPLHAVLAYRNSGVVERIAKDHQVSVQDARGIFEDTLRFLYLAGATDAQHLAPTKNIDKGWHSFLMFTRDYAGFCKSYFGRFIHHQPRLSSDPAPEVDRLALTFDVARNLFGLSLSSNWAFDIHAGDCTKCTSACSSDSGGGGNECCPDHD